MRRPVSALLLLVLLPLAACWGGSTAGPATPEGTAATGTAASPALVGEHRREEIERALPDWVVAEGLSPVDEAAAAELLALDPGPTVLVLFGSWCGDSRRELARLWNAFDQAGGEPRFAIRYVGVERARERRGPELADLDLRFVPTFLVERDGREIGRIVESSPNGIERDLADLLTGRRSGLVSGRTDLGP